MRHELPGVGERLQDHPFVTVLFEVSDPHTLYGADKPKPMAEWMLRRSGPLTSTAAEVAAFVRTRPGLPAADLSFHIGALFFEDHGATEFDGHAATFGPVLVSTRSRGRVWLRSSDPRDKPRILTNTPGRARGRGLARGGREAVARDGGERAAGRARSCAS